MVCGEAPGLGASRPLANPARRPQDGLCPLPVRLRAKVVAGQPVAARAQRAGVCDGDAHRTQTKPCHDPEAITDRSPLQPLRRL